MQQESESKVGELLFTLIAIPSAVLFGLVLIAAAALMLVGMVARHIIGTMFDRGESQAPAAENTNS